ncbi:MAG: hypothetical protein ABII01_05065 [Candidatus Woesearchaeota archaeon]
MKKWMLLIYLSAILILVSGFVSASEPFLVDARTTCHQINETHKQCTQTSDRVNTLDEDGVWKKCEDVLNYEVGDDFIVFDYGEEEIRLEWNYDVKYIGFVNFLKRIFTDIESYSEFDVKRNGCSFYFIQNFENTDFVLDELKYKIPEGFSFKNNILTHTESNISINFNQTVREQSIKISDNGDELVLTGENISRLDPTVGYNDPTVAYLINGAGDCNWVNLDYVLTEDAAIATCDADNNPTDTFGVKTYGFSIPPSADSIDGVGVKIRRSCQRSNSCNDINVTLIVGGTPQGQDKASGSLWSSALVNATYGGLSDTWGLTLNPAQVNADDFGVMFTGISDYSIPRKVEIDSIKMNVTYTEGASDTIYPSFSNLKNNNNTLTDSGVVSFNATITDTNGTAGVEFNDVNYTANNVSNAYNVSFNYASAGNFSYYWWAFGNGTDNNINQTVENIYTLKGDVGGGSCTYGGTGNWALGGSDNCVISSNVNLKGNNFNFSGAGRVTLNANITNFTQGDIGNGIEVTCTPNGCIKI